MQRIQAPTQAVVDHSMTQGPVWAPPAVAPDSDEEYWESKEALADRLAKMETLGTTPFAEAAA
jgi:hypothetical protein